MSEIHLGTIALEPSRWTWLSADEPGLIRVSEWLGPIADAGFDGIELWEPHIRRADETEVRAILDHPLPIGVFNTYVGYDDESDRDRNAAAEWIRRSGAPKVKWNTGADRGAHGLRRAARTVGRTASRPDAHV